VLIATGLHQMVQNKILVADLDKVIASQKDPVDEVQKLRTQAEAQETKIKFFEDILCKKDMNLEILKELTELLPPDTYLSNYTYRDGNIQMIGLAGSASDLVPKLERSPLLKDVGLTGTIIKDQQTGKERFTINAKLER
jgi:general secretion pathway protein L